MRLRAPLPTRDAPLAARRFHFADAFWFHVPLKTLVVGLTAFALLWLYPAIGHGTADDHRRVAFAFGVLGCFILLASVFSVAINDSYLDLTGDALDLQFEAFFRTRIALSNIVRVSDIDPRPRWRYRFGLSTNFRDRVACSHGGRLIEIELAAAQPTQLWPRRLEVRRFWLAVREHEAFVTELRRLRPQAFEAPAVAAEAA